MANDILAFVGPSRSGKTTLMLDILSAHSDRLAIVMSVTTRPPRPTTEDMLFYRFLTRDEFERFIHDGAFIHWVEHAGYYYGTLREDADRILHAKYAIGAFLEQGVQNLRNAGYSVRVIKIRPVGYTPSDDPVRRAEDAHRDTIDVGPDIVLTNDFGPGGKAKAFADLTQYIDSLP